METLPKDPVIEAYKKDVDRTPTLIAVKRAAGRPKDFEAIAELELLLKGAADDA